MALQLTGKLSVPDQTLTPRPKCGIIMPISASEGYTEEHWQDVLQVIQDAADSAGFDADLVSARGKADVIHKTIIDNIFHNEIVVCDVSDMNPNVMIELGLRFAAKKPVIIIFDTEKKYPFDISQLRFYNYGKALRYSALVKFKKELSELIKDVYQDSASGRYKPYLSHFTDVTIDPATVPSEQISIIQALEKITNQISELKSNRNIIDLDLPKISNINRHLSPSQLLINEMIRIAKGIIESGEGIPGSDINEKVIALTNGLEFAFKEDLKQFSPDQIKAMISTAIAATLNRTQLL